jgi:hypothetical protein
MAQQWTAGPKVVRLDKLADELIAAGIVPSWFAQRPDGVIEATVPDGASRATFDGVVAAHNPATYDAQDQQAATRRQQDIDLAKQYLALGNTAATAAQTQAALQATIRLVRALAQIV